MFLDEPTSGLDSAASFKVMSYVRDVAKKNKPIVIAPIHHPSAKMFGLFDKLLFLSGGKAYFSVPISSLGLYFNNISFVMPP